MGDNNSEKGSVELGLLFTVSTFGFMSLITGLQLIASKKETKQISGEINRIEKDIQSKKIRISELNRVKIEKYSRVINKTGEIKEINSENIRIVKRNKKGLFVIDADLKVFYVGLKRQNLRSKNIEEENNSSITKMTETAESEDTLGQNTSSIVVISGFKIEEKNKKIKIIKYIGLERKVEIPKEIKGMQVVEIGEKAFSERAKNEEIISVILPDGIEKIGNYAFYGNIIENISLPSSIKSIGEYSFSNNRLRSITLPDKLRIVNKGVFQNNLLKEIEFNYNVNIISESSFEGNLINKLSFPKNVFRIENNAFCGNPLDEVKFTQSSTLKYVGKKAFSRSKTDVSGKIIGPDDKKEVIFERKDHSYMNWIDD